MTSSAALFIVGLVISSVLQIVNALVVTAKMARRRRTSSPPLEGKVKIAGYVAIQLPGDRESAPWIYLRPHAADVLFLANLPLSVTVETVRRAIPTCADGVEDVVVQRMPNGLACFARVRMNGGPSEVEAVLESPQDWLALECFAEALNIVASPEEWLSAYWRARDLTAVQKWSAATMDTYERCERARREREKAEAAAGSKPDADGFVTVRHGANAVDVNTGATAAAFNPETQERRAIAKKKRGKGAAQGIAPDGFYRWQRRQGKKRELEDLRKRFEDDKKRVAAVRNLSAD